MVVWELIAEGFFVKWTVAQDAAFQRVSNAALANAALVFWI